MLQRRAPSPKCGKTQADICLRQAIQVFDLRSAMLAQLQGAHNPWAGDSYSILRVLLLQVSMSPVTSHATENMTHLPDFCTQYVMFCVMTCMLLSAMYCRDMT